MSETSITCDFPAHEDRSYLLQMFQKGKTIAAVF
jgi:hypothetical protein